VPSRPSSAARRRTLVLERTLADEHEPDVGNGLADARRSLDQIAMALAGLEVRNGPDDWHAPRNPELVDHVRAETGVLEQCRMKASIQRLDRRHPPPAQRRRIADRGADVIGDREDVVVARER
jgi:hypothetical protein